MNGSLLFIISGPAGSGKGSVVAEVLRRDDRFMCAPRPARVLQARSTA